MDGDGAGVVYRYEDFDAERPHYVVNNLFVQTADAPIGYNARVGDGAQVFDGNLYYRVPKRATVPLFRYYDLDGDEQSFDSLADFKRSKHWKATRGAYSPGWEARGVEGDPKLDEDDRPSKRGPAAKGAIELADTTWPGLANERFRGARPPR